MTTRTVFLAIVLAAAASCMSSNSSDTGPAPSSGSSQSSTSGSTATATIPNGASGLTTTAFGANPLNVAVNTTVTWVNNDTVTHTSTPNSGPTWTSGNIAPGGMFSFTFSSAGTFDYHCALHLNMVGRVVVQ